MEVSIRVPDRIGAKLEEQGKDLPRQALEALAASGYREGLLTAAEVQEMLDLASRWETDAFLKRSGAWLHYSTGDLQADAETLEGLLNG